ncbi:hypothetical protein MKX03_035176 [Papaver bracteatum]|nr:hypothetical protein MKX03_035176 [Papaver bracteatum]
MDVNVCKINECQDVEISDVISNQYQKYEVTKCQKVEMKVKLEFDKVKQKTGIRTHKSFHGSVVQAVGYEKLTFDQKYVRNMHE